MSADDVEALAEIMWNFAAPGPDDEDEPPIEPWAQVRDGVKEMYREDARTVLAALPGLGWVRAGSCTTEYRLNGDDGLTFDEAAVRAVAQPGDRLERRILGPWAATS